MAFFAYRLTACRRAASTSSSTTAPEHVEGLKKTSSSNIEKYGSEDIVSFQFASSGTVGY
jgi:hypothetical protein